MELFRLRDILIRSGNRRKDKILILKFYIKNRLLHTYSMQFQNMEMILLNCIREILTITRIIIV